MVNKLVNLSIAEQQILAEVGRKEKVARSPNIPVNEARLPRGIFELEKGKDIRSIASPESIWGKLMHFNRSKEDAVGEWSWGERRDCIRADWETVILPFLSEYAGAKTWGQINAEMKKDEKKNKTYMRTEISKEAQERLEEIGLSDQEEIFRFGMNGKQRLYGFRFGHVFATVWFDREHKIYPTNLQDRGKNK